MMKNLNFNNLLGGCLILSPIIYCSWLNVLAFRHVFLFICASMLFLFSFYYKPLRSIKNIYAILVLVLIWLSYLLNGCNIYVFNGNITFIISVLVYSIIYKYSDIKELNLKKIFSIVVILNIILLILQYIGYDPIFKHYVNPDTLGLIKSGLVNPRFTGFMLSTTNIGFYLTLSSCFFPIGICFLLLPFIILSKATISIIAALLIISWKIIDLNNCRQINIKYLFCFISFVVVGIICFLYFNNDYILNKLTIRWSIWSKIFPICFRNLLGFGVGSWKDFNISLPITQHTNTTWLNLHSQYLQSFWNLGFIGLGIIFFYLKNNILKNINTELGMSIIVCLICFIFQSYLSSYTLIFTIITIFALKEVENVSYNN